MPISINGTGTITGISAGGLPDASVTADELASSAVTTAKVSDGAITYGKLSTSATEADNVAKRTAKAWVNFNGQGTVAIRDDFNVSSITDNGTGSYTVNFSSAMPNTNYCVNVSNDYLAYTTRTSISTSSVSVLGLVSNTGVQYDADPMCVVIFSA